jgi:LysR family transcriptional regulator for bpeEF and oprC
MFQLEDMAIFVAVLEAGNVSRAARARGVAQTTLGRALDRLETQLGMQLVHRSTRALRPTAAGSLFAQRARELLAQAHEVERELIDLSTRPCGSVRLSLCSGYSRRRLLPTLERWIVQHREVSVELRFEDQPVDLAQAGVDLAVRIVPPVAGEGVVTRLESYPHLLVAAPSYLDRAGAPTSPDELAEHACLTLRTDRSWDRWPLRHAGADVFVSIQPAAEVNDAEVLLRLACAGAGVTVLPLFLVEDALREGQLRKILQGWTLPPGSAYVVHARRRRLSAAARDLLACLTEATAGKALRSSART